MANYFDIGAQVAQKDEEERIANIIRAQENARITREQEALNISRKALILSEKAEKDVNRKANIGIWIAAISLFIAFVSLVVAIIALL